MKHSKHYVGGETKPPIVHTRGQQGSRMQIPTIDAGHFTSFIQRDASNAKDPRRQGMAVTSKSTDRADSRLQPGDLRKAGAGKNAPQPTQYKRIDGKRGAGEVGASQQGGDRATSKLKPEDLRR